MKLRLYWLQRCDAAVVCSGGVAYSIEDEGTKILKIKPRVGHQVKEIQVRERDVPNVDLLLSLAAVKMLSLIHI